MTDPGTDSIDTYLKFVPTLEGWAMQVGVVGWVSPHEPSLEWKTFRTWRHEPNAERKDRAKVAAIKRFFRTCVQCRELCNVGHMHDSKLCQGCAERELGVTH